MNSSIHDTGIHYLVGGVLTFLTISSVITGILWYRTQGDKSQVLINLASRIKAWWALVIVFAFAVLFDHPVRNPFLPRDA